MLSLLALPALLVLCLACSSGPNPTASPSNASPSTPTTATPPGGDAGAAVTTPPARPAAGNGSPITLVTLGDSLTAGQGEDPERGYPVRLQQELEARGHPGSTVVNLGRSGWSSQQVIDGVDGESGQLATAQQAIAQATDEGTPVIATLLIGSNDLWYLYNNDGPTSAEDERENLETYRTNVQRIVSTLRAAGARVVVGINDDQSKRPVVTDATMREYTFPAITDAEAAQMSKQATRYAEVVRAVAADNGALVADFLEAPFFRERALLNEDGNHPNARGYDEMAAVWSTALQPLV